MEQNFSTNQIFYTKQKDQIDIFIPVYIKLVCQKIFEVQVTNAAAKMIGSLSIAVSYKGLPQNIKAIINKYIQLSINNEFHTKLSREDSHTQIQVDDQEQIITYHYNTIFDLGMSRNVFMTPFDVQEVAMLITLRTIQASLGKTKVNIKFNCIDLETEDPRLSKHLKFTFSDNADSGEFGIAEATRKILYTNDDKLYLADANKQQKKKKDKDNKDNENEGKKNKNEQNGKNSVIEMKQKKKQLKVKNFQHTIFSLGLYRSPMITILTIFIPIWLLGLVNLITFFTKNNLNERLANIGIVLVAFIAFFPTIKSKIPPTADFTMIDILLFGLLVTTLLCLIESGFVQADRNAPWVWYKSVLFLISFAILILTALVVIILILLYKFYWQPSYNQQLKDSSIHQNKEYKYHQWSNKKCDEYFNSLPKDEFKPIDKLQLK